MSMENPLCPMCRRPLAEPNESRKSRSERGVVAQTEHHFLPKSRGGKGKDKKAICVDCHSAIHAFFDNKELEKQYKNTDEMTPESVIKVMMADEQFGKAIRFISKQSPGKRHKTKKTKERRKQNKYR